MAPVVLGVLLSTVKKTVSRLLVLVVCLGYGVVRPTLGNVAYKVRGPAHPLHHAPASATPALLAPPKNYLAATSNSPRSTA